MESDTLEVAYQNPVSQMGFAMIYHIVTINPNLSDGAFRLYALYLNFAPLGGESAWVSRKRLAEIRGVSEATISKWNTELEKAQLIKRQTRMGKTAKTWILDPRDSETYRKWAQLELDARADRRQKYLTSSVKETPPPTSKKPDTKEEAVKEKPLTISPPAQAPGVDAYEEPIMELEKIHAQQTGMGSNKRWIAACRGELRAADGELSLCGNDLSWEGVGEIAECINGHRVRLIKGVRKTPRLHGYLNTDPPELKEAFRMATEASKLETMRGVYFTGFRHARDRERLKTLILESQDGALENWNLWLARRFQEKARGHNLVIAALQGLEWAAGGPPPNYKKKAKDPATIRQGAISDEYEEDMV